MRADLETDSEGELGQDEVLDVAIDCCGVCLAEGAYANIHHDHGLGHQVKELGKCIC